MDSPRPRHAPPPDGAPALTVGGDVTDTAGFIAAIERAVPGAKGLITASGGDLPIASKMDDAALRKRFPGVKRIPLDEGIQRTLAIFSKRKEQGKLEA